MIRGVRRPEEAAGLGLSQRLLVRLGALLKKKLAVTVPVLELARPGAAMEGLLLDAAVLEHAGTLETGQLRTLAQARAVQPDSVVSVAAADDGMRVLCLQEELDAGEGWGEESAGGQGETLTMAGGTESPTYRITPVGGTLSPAAPAGTAADGLFTRPEVERWRLKLVTAAAATERTEALRTLALAPLTPPEKLDVLLQGLSDRDGAVRAEAAGLLTGLGADADIASALAALNHAEPARRMAAVDRLLKLLSYAPAGNGAADTARSGGLRDLEVGSVTVCALSMLRFQSDAALTGQLLDLLRACAAAVGRNANRLAEVVRVVVGLLATAAKQGVTTREVEPLLIPAHRLMGALAAAVPEALLAVLQAERERCTDLVVEAFLLQCMLDLAPPGSDVEEKLLGTAVSYIGREKEEGRDSRAVGQRVVRRGEKGLLALCGGFAAAHPGAQRYFLLLFDDIWRLSKLTPAGLECAAQTVLHTIETGSKGLRMAAMECRFLTEAGIPEDTRQRLTKAFLDSLSDFTFRSDIEKVESTVARMGLPAAGPLLERLADDRAAEERARAVRLLGEWALNVKAPPGQLGRLQQAVTDVLRRLQALSLVEKFPDRGELLCALGKLVASPAASKEADAVITRALLDTAKGTDRDLVPRALEGLTYVAASRRAQADAVHATAELLRHVLDEMALDIDTDATRRDGETVIEIRGGEQYTKILPILLQGMSRVACSSSCPPATMRDLSKLLLARWKKICNGELIWGPANALLLVRALRDLGCHRGLPPELRLEILRGFAPRHVQTEIMHALTEILAADDTASTATGAVTIGYAILGRRGKDGQFEAEDREDILKALARIVGRKNLGANTPEAQARALSFRNLAVEELFKGVKDIVPFAYESLAALRQKAAVPEEVRHEIERRLKEYESLVVQQ